MTCPNTLLLLAVYGFIFVRLLGPDSAWMMPETLGWKINILSSGTAFSWKDLARGLDWQSFEEQVPRATRFLASYFEILDTKARAWLWNFFVPHPSFSLTWVLSLGLSPFLLYKLVRGFGATRNVALGFAVLFLASPGFLSQVVMLFRTAKPLANFFILLSLYLAFRLDGDLLRKGWLPENIRKFAALWTIMALGMHLDETAWVVFPAVPVFFPRIFSRKGALAAYCALIPITYLVSFHLVPFLAVQAGYPPMDVMSYLPVKNAVEGSPLRSGFGPFLAYAVVLSRLLFMDSVGLTDPALIPSLGGRLLSGVNWMVVVVGLAAVAVALARSFRALPRQDLWHSFAPLLFLPVLCLFHAYTLQLVQQGIWGLFWYGSFFSVFFILALARVSVAALGQLESRAPRISSLFFVIPVLNMLYVFPFTNYAYKKFHYYPYQPQSLNAVFRNEVNRFMIPRDTPADLGATAKTYWSSRRQGLEPAESLPEELAYLKVELPLREKI